MKRTAQFFKALSDETRLRILALLTMGELCVCDLMAVLELPQSTVSRHLATLRHAVLVEDRRQGAWMYYRLSGDGELFRNQVLGLLETHLSILPQVNQDRQGLSLLLARKSSGECG